MKTILRTLAVSLGVAIMAVGQTGNQVNLSGNQVTGVVPAPKGGTGTTPAGSLPATPCTNGKMFVKTNASPTSAAIYACIGTAWVLQSGSAIITTGAIVPSGACPAGALYVNLTPSPQDFYACGPSATWQRFVMTTDSADGKITLQGVVSGQASISVADAAGTPNDILLPTTTGTSGQILSTNGANPQQTSWIAPASVTSVGLAGTANQITVTGTCTITTTGTCTFSIPSGPTFPGTVTAGNSFVAGPASSFIAPNNGAFYWNSQSILTSPSDGVIKFSNNAGTDFSRLQFGGTTASFPAFKRSSAKFQVRLADDSAAGTIESKYNSSDGSAGVTGATCSAWKDGLCTTP